jgi:hypothetical protein
MLRLFYFLDDDGVWQPKAKYGTRFKEPLNVFTFPLLGLWSQNLFNAMNLFQDCPNDRLSGQDP